MKRNLYGILLIISIVFFVNCSSVDSSKKTQKSPGGVAELLDKWKDIDANLINLDSFPEGEARLEAERKAVEKLWNAIIDRTEDEGFELIPSDAVLLYLIGDRFDRKRQGLIFALPALVETNFDNEDQVRFFGEYIEKLIKYYPGIDPSKGKTIARKGNLKLLKSWLEQLNACSHLEDDLVVGMLKFRGDRIGEEYGQDEKRENYYWSAIEKYEKAIKRTHEKRSKIILGSDIAINCSRFRGKDRSKLINEYKRGLMRSAESLSLLDGIDSKEWDVNFPRWETRKEGLASLQKVYGNNLTGLLYNLFLDKRDKEAIEYKKYLDVDFLFEKKYDCYIAVGECSCRLFRSDMKNQQYRKECSENASRAYKYALSLFGGQPPDSYDPIFCKVFNYNWHWLNLLGEAEKADRLDMIYGHICPPDKKASKYRLILE